MSRFVPHDIDYKYLQRIDGALTWILRFAAFTSLATLAFDIFKIWPKENAFYQQLFNSFTSLFSVFYFLMDIVFNFFFQASEVKRRKDFIDNSLGTNLSDVNSQGYYSNELNPTGIIKMGVNCFENSFFSKSISSKMLIKATIKAILVCLIFLSVAIFTNNKTITTVLQLALPLTIIQQTIKLFFYREKIAKVYDDFVLIFNSTNGNDQQSLIIKNVINYEATLAWGSILLDSSIFKKMNPELSQKWANIKSRLNII